MLIEEWPQRLHQFRSPKQGRRTTEGLTINMTGYRKLEEKDVTSDQRARLLSAAKVNGHVSAVSQGNLGGEVAFLLVGALLLLGGIGILAIDTSGATWREPAAIAAGAALLIWSVLRLVKRSQSSLGTFTLATDAYYITCDAGTLSVWSWAACTDTKVTHFFKNGMYNGTQLECTFAGKPLFFGDRVSDQSQSVAVVAAQSKVFSDALRRISTAKARAAAGSWHSLEGADLLPS